MLNKKSNLFLSLLLGVTILFAVVITGCNNSDDSKDAKNDTTKMEQVKPAPMDSTVKAAIDTAKKAVVDTVKKMMKANQGPVHTP